MISAAILALALAADRKPAPTECADLSGIVGVRTEPRIIRQGTTIVVRPFWTRGYDGEKDAPWACFRKWRTSDPAIAAIDPRTGKMTVASAARPGTVLTLYATFRGQERTMGVWRIVGANQVVLTGVWHEKERNADCAGRRVAELRFNDSDGYDFTFPERMVETMVSGGGTYSWDAATNQLDLGGRTYRAIRSGSTLTLEGPNFDTAVAPVQPGSTPPPVCRLTFSGG